MNLNHPINFDHELLILDLHPDELEMARICAVKVKSHLERLCEKNTEYLSNLTMVNSIISQYEKAIQCGSDTAGLN